MPWSPLNYVKDIFSELSRDSESVSLNELTKAIIKHTGLVRDNSIRNLIKVFERLGFIEIDYSNKVKLIKINWDEVDAFIIPKNR